MSTSPSIFAASKRAAACSAGCLRLGLIDRQGTALQFCPVKAANRLLGVLRVRHLDKAKPARLPGELIANDIGGRYRADLAKQVRQLRLRRTKREITDK
jgi:hypothetical protein